MGPVRAEKVDLAWKFAAGEQADYVLGRDRVAKLDLNGNEIEIGISNTVDLHLTVRSIEADTFTVELKLNRIKMKVDSPIELVEYDSAGLIPGDESSLWPSLKDRLEKLVGSQATVILSKKGEVREVTLPDDVVSALEAESPNPQVQRFMSGVFDVAGIKSMIKQTFAPLPQDPSDVGSQWKTNEEIDRPPFGKVKVDRTLTYVGKDEGSGDYDNISLVTKVDFEMAEGENAEEISLKIVEQEGKGNIEFDSEAGRTREMEFAQTMKMEISYGGNEIVQDLTETTTLRQGVSEPFVAPQKVEADAEKKEADSANP
jgi:hypothetical protein